MAASDSYNEALSAAIRHIGIATYSSGKIHAYLVNKGFPEDVSSSVVQELINREYINDHKASRKVLMSRTGKKQESKSYIYKRLLEAGISDKVADDVVLTLADDNATCDLLFESLGYDNDSEETREAMITVALRRGYTLECAARAYRRWSDNQ